MFISRFLEYVGKSTFQSKKTLSQVEHRKIFKNWKDWLLFWINEFVLVSEK